MQFIGIVCNNQFRISISQINFASGSMDFVENQFFSFPQLVKISEGHKKKQEVEIDLLCLCVPRTRQLAGRRTEVATIFLNFNI